MAYQVVIPNNTRQPNERKPIGTVTTENKALLNIPHLLVAPSIRNLIGVNHADQTKPARITPNSGYICAISEVRRGANSSASVGSENSLKNGKLFEKRICWARFALQVHLHPMRIFRGLHG